MIGELLLDRPDALPYDLAGVRVVILTTFDEDAEILEAIRAGASGYLLKDLSPDRLRTSIRAVAAGEPIFSPDGTTATCVAASCCGSYRGSQVRWAVTG